MYVRNMECMQKMENSGHICSFMMIYRQKLELRFQTLKKHPNTHKHTQTHTPTHDEIENDRVMEHNKKNDDTAEKEQKTQQQRAKRE